MYVLFSAIRISTCSADSSAVQVCRATRCHLLLIESLIVYKLTVPR
jgi:hypothetical protein